MIVTKICGLTDEASMTAALTGGAGFVGLVFFAKSPRHLSLERAAALATIARDRTAVVAVTVDADDEALAAIASTVRPDFIQCHGQETPARVAAVRRFARRGVIKALAIARADDFAPVPAFEAVADMLLFDAKAPAGAALPGGNGAAFDWPLLAGRRFAKPWFLSGGLTPETVKDAVAASGARWVDVSSGVERAPGVKEPSKIAAFLAAAHAA